MILVDTSVWIAFLKNDSREVASCMRNILEQGDVCTVSCVFGELLQGAKNSREKNVLNEYFHCVSVLSGDLWREAGEYSFTHKLIDYGIGLIDAVLLVSAEKYEVKLWTLDKKLSRFAEKRGVSYHL